MTEPTRTPTRDELNQYIVEARRLRSQEIARLSGLLLHTPGRLYKRARRHPLPGIVDSEVHTASHS